MWKKVLFGLAAPVLALVGFATVTVGQGKPADSRVICCGGCGLGDDCLAKCAVVGEAPKDVKLTCCGHCQKGDDCPEKCRGKGASCCKVK